jgi:molecular chaperone HscA
MQLIEIQEPNKISDSPEDEVAIGIDFGTTNSLVAVMKDGRPYVIEMVPSVVGEGDDGNLAIMPDGIRSIKRLLGKSVGDIEALQPGEFIFEDEGALKIKLGGQSYDPIEISAVILSYLKAKAEEHLGKSVSKAVITVPAYFDDAARNAVSLAARMAGLDVLRLINEPTAAALAYGLDNAAEGVYLVYDFGGGTFDVSVLNMRMGVFQVLATGGDAMLGGDDLDSLLQKKLGKSLLEVRALKEALSSCDRHGEEDIKLDYHGAKAPCNDDKLAEKDISINRAEFEALVMPLIQRTIDITSDVLAQSEKTIKGIILVGGSSRIPLIKQELKRKFLVDVFDDLDPDRVVALGAAVQAEHLIRPSGNLLIDVVALSLGIELMGGINEKIIARNSALPTSVSKKFTTYADNQTAMQFHIVQGEREMAADCRSLAKFELKNIPPMQAGLARIDVTFGVDVDGLVSISAKEELTGIEQIVEIKPTYGLSQEEAIEMLRNAYANAEEDHHKRQLEETIFKAGTSLKQLESALLESEDLLSEEELKDIDSIITALKEAVLLKNRDNILQKLEKLLTISDEFALRRLNHGVSAALKGKHIDEVNSAD